MQGLLLYILRVSQLKLRVLSLRSFHLAKRMVLYIPTGIDKPISEFSIDIMDVTEPNKWGEL